MAVNEVRGLSAVVLLGLSACATPPQTPIELPTNDPAVDQAAVAAVLTELIEGDHASDARRVASLFAKNAVLMPPGDALVVGRDAIEARFAQGFEQAELDFTLAPDKTLISGDLAVSRGERKGWMRWRNGRPATEIHDKYAMHLVRQEDQWLIESLIWNRIKQAPSQAQADINFILQHGSSAEQATVDTLISLISKYDLSRWAYTKTVMVNDRGQPRARPVLSLNTRYRRQEELLLAKYLNAQMRWLLSFDPVATQAAVGELRTTYPDIPVDVPTNGYVSMLAGYLEYQALTELLGHEAAFRALAHWTLGDDAWVYNVVLADTQSLGQIVTRHGLNY